MYLRFLLLQHFRNYTQKKIDFSPNVTVVVGRNTAGKTNLCEAISLLSTGKSFHAEKDTDMIAFGQEVARVQGSVSSQFMVHGSRFIEKGELVTGSSVTDKQKTDKQESENRKLETDNRENIKLEVTLAQGDAAGGRFIKKFAVNQVPKSRNSFVGLLPTVFFRPEDLDLIIDGPSMRRNFLDNVLEQVDKAYRMAKLTYDKALRQRNALLDITRESGIRDNKQFNYWDALLIENGTLVTKKREEFINYINESKKDVFDFSLYYDMSVMSEERLLQYKEAEMAAGNTLVGPQRDDFIIFMNQEGRKGKNIQQFGSRGQQRLAILQLKLVQLRFMEESLKAKPLLVLDDIFSELDEKHIHLVLEKMQQGQVVLTTTHKEFIDTKILKMDSVIEL